jgi:hypothetical protein
MKRSERAKLVFNPFTRTITMGFDRTQGDQVKSLLPPRLCVCTERIHEITDT